MSDDVMIARRPREPEAGVGIGRGRRASALTAGGTDGNEQFDHRDRRDPDRPAGGGRVHDPAAPTVHLDAPVRRPAADRACPARDGEHRLPVRALYTHNPEYRVKRPPEVALRLIAPIVVVSTVAVLAVILIPEFAAWTAHGVFVHHHHRH
jgi:hypothetical protein